MLAKPSPTERTTKNIILLKETKIETHAERLSVCEHAGGKTLNN